MLRRSISAATLVAIVASTASAQSQGRQGYVTVKADGRRIEGRIEVKDGRVTVWLGSNSSTDFAADEVKITYTEETAASPDSSGGKKRTVEIERKDGTTIRGEVVEEKADSITIKPRGGATITFKLSDTNRVTPLEDANPGEADLGERWVDYEGRFQLERPNADWKLRKSTSPDTRAIMTLSGKDAFVSVSVKPVATVNAAYLDPTRDNAKKCQSEVDAEIKSELEKYAGLQIDCGEIFGAPVVEARYEGSYPSEATTYQFIEQRFVRDGLLYAIRAAAEKKNTFKEVEPKLREAFTSFSFIAPQGGDDQSYNDLVKGFGIERPSPKWTIDARPFDEREPVVIRNEDRRAELRVLSIDAQGREAAQYADEYLKGTDNKAEFTVVDKKPGRRGTADVVTYHCTYFEGRSSRKCDEQGVISLVENRFVHVIGTAPFADADAKDLQKEVARALDAIKIFDPKRKRLGDGARAVEEFGKGVDAAKKKQWADAISFLNEAIKLYPDYAQAYFWRASCNLENRAWKDYRDDLQRVFDLDPRPETAARAGSLYLAEAMAHQKDKQWSDACKAWKEAVRSDPKNDRIRKEFIKFFQDWWAELKRANPGVKAKEGIDELEEHRWSDKEFEPVLANMMADAAMTVLGADRKQWQKARSIASKALSYDKDCKAAKDAIKACEDARKQIEQSQPKPKK